MLAYVYVRICLRYMFVEANIRIHSCANKITIQLQQHRGEVKKRNDTKRVIGKRELRYKYIHKHSIRVYVNEGPNTEKGDGRAKTSQI